MTYDINADSYPDYDGSGYDDFWKLPEWQNFYDKLIQKYGADEGSRRWLDAWWRNDYWSHPVQNEVKIQDWATSKGLWGKYTMTSSSMLKPSEFVAPYVPNQGQVVTIIDPKTGLPKTEIIGNQPNVDAEKTADEKKKKINKGLLIGGGVVVIGLTIVYFVLKAKSRVQ